MPGSATTKAPTPATANRHEAATSAIFAGGSASRAWPAAERFKNFGTRATNIPPLPFIISLMIRHARPPVGTTSCYPDHWSKPHCHDIRQAAQKHIGPSTYANQSVGAMQIHQSPRLTWHSSPQKINKHQLVTPAVCLFRIGLDRADEAVRVRPILLEERPLLDPLKSKFVHAEVTRSQLAVFP